MIKNLGSRFTQLIIFIALLLALLGVRLFVLSVFQNESWSEASENLSVKSVYSSSPRGQIYDRYGRLLAGNVQTFSVQFNGSGLKTQEINDTALSLARLLEQNGDTYVDNFPIVIDEYGNFAYTYQQSIDQWLKSMELPEGLSAEEAFSELRSIYGVDESLDVFEAQESLQNVFGLYIPITVRLMKYTGDVDRDSFLDKYNLPEGSGPAEAFAALRSKFSIDRSLSAEDARKILVIRNELFDMGYRQYLPATIANGISEKSIVEIEERSKEFPGTSVVSKLKRYYPNGSTASHIIGYMGRISEANKEYYVDELGYNAGDLIGMSGLESSLESILHGTDGVEYLQVNASGKKVKSISNTPPKKGKDVYITMDLELQKVAEDALQQALDAISTGGVFHSKYGDYNYGKAYKNANVGAVVALEVETGDVLCMASNPDFDLNLFAEGISSEDWNSLQSKNPRDQLAPAPLYNVATRSAVQPGSTFKMVTATAALDQGLNPNTRLRDGGFVMVGNRPYNCLIWTTSNTTHGSLNLPEALEVSCNYYFYDVATGKDYYTGRSLGYDMDIDTIMKYARQYGLGEATGIEISETVAPAPSAESKMRSQKALLRYALNANAEKFFKTRVLADPELLSEKIEEIVSWADENPVRSEIIERLSESDMGIKEGMEVELAELCKYTYFNYAEWTLGDEFNIAIGQGENAYTPLQMANYIATIGNGGLHNKVSLIKTIEGEGKREKEEAAKVDITDENLSYIIDGMNRVAQGSKGSLRGVFGTFPVKVAAKSGTATKDGKINWPDELEYLKTYLPQILRDVSWEEVESEAARLMEEYPSTYTNRESASRRAIINLSGGTVSAASIDRFKEDYSPFAWVVAMAPADDPKIAVATLIFQGGTAAYAAPVAREVIGAYLRLGTEYEGYSITSGLK